MPNLFVSYDLDAPGQNYAKVEAAIEALGQAKKIQFSLYYVKSGLSAKDAEARIWAVLDSNDRLIVIEGKDAWFHNLFPGALEFIQALWAR